MKNYLIKRDNCIKVSNGGNNSDVLKFSKILDFHTVQLKYGTEVSKKRR